MFCASGGYEAVAKRLTSELMNKAIGITEDFDQGVRIINDLAVPRFQWASRQQL